MVRITLKNVNRAAYRSLDQVRLNHLGSSALYFKIKPEFCDEQELMERPVDRHLLHDEFAGYLEEEATRERIPKAIKDDVVSYGTELMKKVVASRNTGVS